MADDLTRRAPEDPTKINLDQSWEVHTGLKNSV
jgi:hypothetical protein